jgi:hypothetical protein
MDRFWNGFAFQVITPIRNRSNQRDDAFLQLSRWMWISNGNLTRLTASLPGAIKDPD